MIKKILIGLLITLICLIAYIFLIAVNVKYTEEIEINANIDTVVALFDNPYNMQKYMDGIESYTVLSGNLREVGTKAEIVATYIEKDVVKRRIVMIEEIITNNLPEEKKVTYTSDEVYNIVTNRIIKISDNKTKFINEQEFQFKGFMKVMGFFMPNAFKQQSRIYLKNFKEFVENQ